MIAAYVLMIKRGLKTINDVPEAIREHVREALDAD